MFLEQSGAPLRGYSIFVREDGAGTGIMMESGSGKVKKAEIITAPQARDSRSAPYYQESAADQIPSNSNSNKVYTSILLQVPIKAISLSMHWFAAGDKGWV